MVLTVDIGECGYDGACVLALVRYVTGMPEERNGRRLIDSEMWWQASYDEIGEALGGMSRHSVGRTVRRLESEKILLSKSIDTHNGDQTKAYRVADQQRAESHTGVDQQCAESHEPLTSNVRNRKGPVRNRTTPRAISHDPPCEIAHSIPSMEELKEEQEIERGERAQTREVALSGDTPTPTAHLPAIVDEEPTVVDAELVDDDQWWQRWTEPPPLWCKKHPGGGVVCSACINAEKVSKLWMNTPNGLAWQRQAEANNHRARVKGRDDAKSVDGDSDVTLQRILQTTRRLDATKAAEAERVRAKRERIAHEKAEVQARESEALKAGRPARHNPLRSHGHLTACVTPSRNGVVQELAPTGRTRAQQTAGLEALMKSDPARWGAL